jgi:hypothetical protein
VAGVPDEAGPSSATARWRAQYDAYVAEGLPWGADVPGLEDPSLVNTAT